jgi:hypothetical protein
VGDKHHVQEVLEASTQVVPLVLNESEESISKFSGVPEVTNFLAGLCKEVSSTINCIHPCLDVISNIYKVINY